MSWCQKQARRKSAQNFHKANILGFSFFPKSTAAVHTRYVVGSFSRAPVFVASIALWWRDFRWAATLNSTNKQKPPKGATRSLGSRAFHSLHTPQLRPCAERQDYQNAREGCKLVIIETTKIMFQKPDDHNEGQTAWNCIISSLKMQAAGSLVKNYTSEVQVRQSRNGICRRQCVS